MKFISLVHVPILSIYSGIRWLFICFLVKAGKGGDLTHDETTIIAGALELTEKTAKDAMTPISKAFSLDLDATLNLWVCEFFYHSLHCV